MGLVWAVVTKTGFIQPILGSGRIFPARRRKDETGRVRNFGAPKHNAGLRRALYVPQFVAILAIGAL